VAHSSTDPLVQVEPSSPVPLYYQVANVLQARIFAGTNPPGSLLGTEKELALEFGVSRITVRKAIDILHRDGLLEAHRGRGTFVSSDPRPVAPTALHVFLDDILTRAEALRVIDDHFAEIPAAAAVASRLGIPPGTPIVHVQRQVTATDAAASVWVTYFLPLEIWRTLDPDRRTEMLLPEIDHLPGLRLTQGREVIHALGADAETAARLGVAVGSPVLRVEREYQTESGQTVVFGWVDHRQGTIPVLLSRAHR
jgi:GntR family transcriptional regulator